MTISSLLPVERTLYVASTATISVYHYSRTSAQGPQILVNILLVEYMCSLDTGRRMLAQRRVIMFQDDLRLRPLCYGQYCKGSCRIIDHVVTSFAQCPGGTEMFRSPTLATIRLCRRLASPPFELGSVICHVLNDVKYCIIVFKALISIYPKGISSRHEGPNNYGRSGEGCSR
ncbi:hypothetical protein CPB85DRAFT_756559 [Mucidula mucida]|nr:hypothetical protein CPB85DRAFT_756559 [Mucidula mucida]